MVKLRHQISGNRENLHIALGRQIHESNFIRPLIGVRTIGQEGIGHHRHLRFQTFGLCISGHCRARGDPRIPEELLGSSQPTLQPALYRLLCSRWQIGQRPGAIAAGPGAVTSVISRHRIIIGKSSQRCIVGVRIPITFFVRRISDLDILQELPVVEVKIAAVNPIAGNILRFSSTRIIGIFQIVDALPANFGRSCRCIRDPGVEIRRRERHVAAQFVHRLSVLRVLHQIPHGLVRVQIGLVLRNISLPAPHIFLYWHRRCKSHHDLHAVTPLHIVGTVSVRKRMPVGRHGLLGSLSPSRGIVLHW